MKSISEMYNEKVMTADQALDLIQDGDYMFSAQAGGEPAAILSHLQHLKDTGVKNTTLNTCLPLQHYPAFFDPEMEGVMNHNGWFFGAGQRADHKSKFVSPVPQSSTSILRKTLDRIKYDGRRPVVLATVSPMDSHGYMSLSISAIYERDLIDRAPSRSSKLIRTSRAPSATARSTFLKSRRSSNPTARSRSANWRRIRTQTLRSASISLPSSKTARPSSWGSAICPTRSLRSSRTRSTSASIPKCSPKR